MAYLKRDDKLLVIIGPSGAGKSSVVKLLHDRGVVVVTPSWTTRPPRPDEADGALEHRFVDETAFTDKAETGYFLEARQLFGLPYWYGLPKIEKAAAGQVPTVMLRASLLPLLDTYYSNYMVYQIEDELGKIERRLRERQAAGHEPGSRLKGYQEEIAAGRERADRVFVNDSSLETLAGRIAAALSEDGLAPGSASGLAADPTTA